MAKNIRYGEWKIAPKPKKEDERVTVRAPTGLIISSHEEYSRTLWVDTNVIVRCLSMFQDEEWLAEKARYALQVLRKCVERDPEKHGGVPVLRGTRFTIPSLFAEMSEGRSIFEIAEDHELDKDQLRELLEGLSIHFDQPLVK